MKKQSKITVNSGNNTPIIFFGTEDFSARSLEKLIKSQFNIVAIVTKPDSKQGRGHKMTPPQVKTIAQNHNIPIWQPKKVIEIEKAVKDIPSVAGVLVSYGKIIPKSTLELFSPGIINLHPSLLPKYRGPSPIEAAILNGDEETGLSIMRLAPEMDAGPVYFQKRIALSGHEEKPELYEKLSSEGADLLAEKLPSILEQSVKAKDQDSASATYCNLLKKDDGTLKPEQMTAIECERHVRAFLGFPRSRLVINEHDCIITQSSITNSPESAPLVITCKNKTYLSIEKLIAPSGKLLDASSFLLGYK